MEALHLYPNGGLDLRRELARQYDVRVENVIAGSGSEGVVVTEVDPNGLASDQGFKTGDVIFEVGGKKVANPVDVRSALSEAQKDGKRTILMRVKSGEETRFVAVRLAKA